MVATDVPDTMAGMQPGDVVAGRFDVEALVGAGGMGRVHRARDRHTGDPVALKVLLRDDTSHVTRFAHEARALAELSHPGIVRYVAHGLTETGDPYLAMEWLEGEDLSRRLARGGLSIEQAVRLASRVAEALGAAHARSIVHRDIKPSNVFLLDERAEGIKVLDFGIARLASHTRVTRTGMMVGTPGYMAPEQVQNGRAVDARADVFSLGCVLFECLTSTRAFAGEQLVAVLAKVLFTEPLRLRELRPEVPPALERLVTQMLAKDPQARPGDGAAVVGALAALAPEVGEAAAAAAAHASAALTRNERRTVSVVLIHAEAPIDGGEQTLADAEASAVEVLRRGAEVFGGRLEPLRDGSIVVTLTGAGPPTDQAAQAARCALWLRDRAGAHTLALATGRGEPTGRKTAAEAIDRAIVGGRAGERAAAIPIDETTARLLDGRFDVREHEAGPMLHGERELADGTRSLLSRPTPCVGRDRELSTLVELFCGCVEDSQAHLALVTGPAGIGKSRLVHELLARLRTRVEPFTVWIGRGDALRAGSALSLLAHAVRGACGIRGDEPLAERRDKLSARVARHVEPGQRRRVAELLGELVDAPFLDETSELLRAARMNAQLMAGELRRAWVDFLRAELEARPVLLVLEDLHWGDSSSVQFIDAALRELGEGRWMVLALARPEVHELLPRLWAERRMQTIALGPLGRAAGERLVRQVLGDEIGPETLARLVAQADGNAFYLEELIRAVAERRTDVLPETVVAMVQARLSALAEEDRRALRAAAVFGEAFWPAGVAVLLGSDHAATVERRLSGLVEREVLVRRSESRFLGQVELAFRHMLLREGAYEMLTDEDRVLGHRLAGEWLERVGERDAKLLAGHFDRGGDEARAAIHFLRAAEQAIELGDAPAALTLAERAVGSCTEPELIAKLRTVEAEARFWSGDLGGARRAAAEALRSTRPGSHTEGRALHIAIWSVVDFRDGDSLVQSLDTLLHTDPEDEAIALHVSTLHAVITSLLLAARPNVAEMCLRRVEQLAATRMERDSFIAAWVELSRAAWATHVERDSWGARECFRRYAAHQASWEQRGSFPSGGSFIALHDSLLGLFDESDREFELARASTTSMEWSYYEQFRGIAAIQHRLEEACSTLARLVHESKTPGNSLPELSCRIFLVEALVRAGRIDAAESEALALGDAVRPEPYLAMQYGTVMACLRLAQGRAQDASTLAEAALSLSHAHGMGCATTHALLLLVRAEAFHALGDHAAARRAIREAEADVLRRAARIPDPDVRRCFLERIPDHQRALELAREWLREPANEAEASGSGSGSTGSS